MRSDMLSGLARQAIGASLVVAMSVSGVALAGCGSGGTDGAAVTAGGDATDGAGAGDGVVPQKGDGGAGASDLGGLDALGDLAAYPEGYENRVRSDLADVAGSLSEDEVGYAAAALWHLEDKYGLDFKLVSVRPPLTRDDDGTWTAILECQDGGYAYGEGDGTMGMYLRKQGDLRWVACSAHRSGDGVVLCDDMVLQLRGMEIGESIKSATDAALAKHEGLVIQQESFVQVPTAFKGDSLGDADRLSLDSPVEEIVPLVRFGSVGTVGIALPDDREAMDLAEEIAGDIREAYSEIGMSDEEGAGAGWSLTLMLNGDVSRSAVLGVTADAVTDLAAPVADDMAE